MVIKVQPKDDCKYIESKIDCYIDVQYDYDTIFFRFFKDYLESESLRSFFKIIIEDYFDTKIFNDITTIDILNYIHDNCKYNQKIFLVSPVFRYI